MCRNTAARGLGCADLSQLNACISTLGPLLDKPCLVVGKSTGPIGAAAALAGKLTQLAAVGGEAEIAWNPEFLREGHAVDDSLRPDRIVAGVHSLRAESVLRRLYAAPLSAGSELFVTDLATAELAKAAANSFLLRRSRLLTQCPKSARPQGGMLPSWPKFLARTRA